MKQVVAAGAVFCILILVVVLMMTGDREAVVDAEVEPVQATASVELDSGDGTAGDEGAQSGNDEGEAVDASDTAEDGSVQGQDGADDYVPLPSFDIVRVEPNGDAVIAGRTEPGSTVTIMSHDGALAEVATDDSGAWVAILDQPLAPGDHELWVSAQSEDGKRLESNVAVVMSVPDAVAGETAVATVEEGDDSSGGFSLGNAASSSGNDTSLGLSQDSDTGNLSTADAASAVDEALDEAGAGLTGDEVLAVVVPRDGTGDIDVLQAPGDGVGISGGGDLTLDSLSYDTDGNVTLSGQAEPGATVVPYVDGEPAGQTTADADGAWQLTLDKELAEGQYDLRVDQLGEGGDVSARLETPFQQAAFTMPTTDEPVIVIQPGNNLWVIARKVYGEGTLFTQIFEANSNQIADPDLIYPGQIFVLPAPDASGG